MDAAAQTRLQQWLADEARVRERIAAGQASATPVSRELNLVRALRDDVSRVRAEGRVVHPGNQVATAEARLVGPDGRLYAHGTTTCLVFAVSA